MKNLFLILTIIVSLSPMAQFPLDAQIFTNIHTFTGSDGAYPEAELFLSGNTLYGTTYSGLSSGNGGLFKVNTNGAGFASIHNFTASPNVQPPVNSDGANSQAGLILDGNTLYGTARNGGIYGNGTVFRVNTDGSGFTNLHNFTVLFRSTNSDGARPYARLLLSGNTLYGTTYYGGLVGYGAVFAVNTDGTGFTNLHNFKYSDGSSPAAGLILSGDVLYGTSYLGGSGGNGTVFSLNTNGTSFTNLHHFPSLSGPLMTNSEGATPYANLVLSENILYGEAYAGGTSGKGTVFALQTDGTAFTNLHSLQGNEGTGPFGGLVLAGNTLYGTTYSGGNLTNGTVFAVNINGTSFTTLHHFNYASEGGYPLAGLALSGNNLYGTAQGGGFGVGTIFNLFILPPLTITPSDNSVILNWPTNASSFALQSTTNLSPVIIWSPATPLPSVVNGQFSVTNFLEGPQKFYRLSQ